MKANIAKEDVNCNLCKSHSGVIAAQATDREYPTTSDIFNLIECSNCGLLYLNPRPHSSELDVIYPQNYHAYNIRPPAQPETGELKPFTTRIRHKIYSQRLKEPITLLRNNSKIDMLDIGCGDGWMLDLYKEIDPNRINTYGVDFNVKICETARTYGHTIYCGRFEDLKIDRQFDLINMSHVIEHVEDPVKLVAHVINLLKPGGIFVVETPNIDCKDREIFGTQNWGALHVPRHWNLFNAKTLSLLGESAGFETLKIKYFPAPVHWVWGIHNKLLACNFPGRNYLVKFFDPLSVFESGVKSFFMLSTFTIFDMFLLGITGRGSNMMAIFRKP